MAGGGGGCLAARSGARERTGLWDGRGDAVARGCGRTAAGLPPSLRRQGRLGFGHGHRPGRIGALGLRRSRHTHTRTCTRRQQEPAWAWLTHAAPHNLAPLVPPRSRCPTGAPHTLCAKHDGKRGTCTRRLRGTRGHGAVSAGQAQRKRPPPTPPCPAHPARATAATWHVPAPKPT